jgi:hypothetical protein
MDIIKKNPYMISSANAMMLQKQAADLRLEEENYTVKTQIYYLAEICCDIREHDEDNYVNNDNIKENKFDNSKEFYKQQNILRKKNIRGYHQYHLQQFSILLQDCDKRIKRLKRSCSNDKITIYNMVLLQYYIIIHNFIEFKKNNYGTKLFEYEYLIFPYLEKLKIQLINLKYKIENNIV